MLGVDVGGVIIDRASEDSDTSFFGENYLLTPPVPGAFKELGDLTLRFGRRVHVISKCGPSVEGKTRSWLRSHDFFEITGIPTDNLHFVRTREEKAPICEALGVTHFIDDRVDVLQSMTSVRNRVLFLGGNPPAMHPSDIPIYLAAARTWQEITALIAVPHTATS
ncbi:MAG: hypothetical protein WBA31_04350 [Candidatus Dormiibacterota bacterium]